MVARNPPFRVVSRLVRPQAKQLAANVRTCLRNHWCLDGVLNRADTAEHLCQRSQEGGGAEQPSLGKASKTLVKSEAHTAQPQAQSARPITASGERRLVEYEASDFGRQYLEDLRSNVQALDV